MKRTELRRYVELRSYSTLRRCAPLRPVSDKRRRDNQERRVVVGAMRATSDGRCPRCGLYGMPLHGHERLNRAQGGDILQPNVLICDPCNMAIEDDPRVSSWNGWKISSKWPHDPTLTPSQARSLDGLIVEFEMPVSA